LPLPSGQPLGDQLLIAIAPFVDRPGQVSVPAVHVRHALIVAATVLHPNDAADFPHLPGLAEEIAAVRETFSGADALEGSAATGMNIEAHLSSADALHFAGHAVAKPDGIEFLVAPDLGGRGRSGGRWRPAAGGTRLGLVVLSVCSAARFEEIESPEPQHVASAMLLSGTRQVVASLWNTDSAAASRFMQMFYRNLRQGLSSAQSMQAAAREVRAQPGWRNPYYWASFMLFVRS
jgi:CHAT domain-containing protein